MAYFQTDNLWVNRLPDGVAELIGMIIADDLRGLEPQMARHHLLLGTRVGRRVFIDTVQISEFDLVQIGDDACRRRTEQIIELLDGFDATGRRRHTATIDAHQPTDCKNRTSFR